MTASIAFAAIGLLAAGIFTGIIGPVERGHPPRGGNLTPTRQATGTVTRAGYRLTGVHVRVPHPTAAADRESARV